MLATEHCSGSALLLADRWARVSCIALHRRRCTKNRKMDIDQVYEDIQKGAAG